MDFALPHVHTKSVATASGIRRLPVEISGEGVSSLDSMLLEAANKAAAEIILVNDAHGSDAAGMVVDCSAYPERITPLSETIQPNSLVVIFESFDNLKFCYAKEKDIFCNRNGHFHHDDFIGKPFGCKIRSRNNRGYGFVFLLKPTPELWARSLVHRTQIVHELDASMIVFYLNLRPNQVVCESGTGSGALSHCLMRSIAPNGTLHTYEFNQQRAETAAAEFAKHGVSHLVTVHHKDVCGKHGPGGFDRPQVSVDAVVLDLPEPWLAVPFAAYCIKPNGRLVSYSPCVEQSQQAILALKKSGFHSIRTMEFRLKEHYVDEVEYELPPKEKRPRMGGNFLSSTRIGDRETEVEDENTVMEGQDNDIVSTVDVKDDDNKETSVVAAAAREGATPILGGDSPLELPSSGLDTEAISTSCTKRKKLMVARPFVSMRGHTAFLTFATAGNKVQPNPLVTAVDGTTA
jgi:tRNA (adenine57-N1/adenine58-N1)-methyltransferase